MRNRYLVHHGIKGQKWGVQNGPPYPLDHQRQKQYKRAKTINTAAKLGIGASIVAGTPIMDIIKNSDHKVFKMAIEVGKGYISLVGPLGVAGLIGSTAAMIGSKYVMKKIEEEREAMDAELDAYRLRTRR